MARRHGHAGATLIDFNDGIQVAEVELGINTLHVKIQRHGDNVEVAGALAVAEKRAFDALTAGVEFLHAGY